MPRARGDKEYRLPIKGLNTEANVLDFPQDSAVDINNIVVDFNPLTLRIRLGHTDGAFSVDTIGNLAAGTGSSAISWFLWEKAGGDSDTNFLIVQSGGTIHFIDADSINVDTALIGSLGLSALLSGTTKGQPLDERTIPLEYARVKGHVIITSEAIDPTILRYDPVAVTITVTKLDLQVRDIVGLESGIEVDKRPTAIGDFPVGSTASGTFPDLSEEHEYNLYNQGWHQQRRLTSGSKVVSDPIAEFDTQNSEFPSNADIVFIGMVDSSGDLIFDAEFLKDQTFGSSPAARGRFVVNAFDIDRETPRGTPGDSGAFTGGGGSDGGDGGSGWVNIVLDAL